MPFLHVKDENGQIIHSVEVKNTNPRHVEKVMMGMLINMNPDYYIDDSEFDDLDEQPTSAE